MRILQTWRGWQPGQIGCTPTVGMSPPSPPRSSIWTWRQMTDTYCSSGMRPDFQEGGDKFQHGKKGNQRDRGDGLQKSLPAPSSQAGGSGAAWVCKEHHLHMAGKLGGPALLNTVAARQLVHLMDQLRVGIGANFGIFSHRSSSKPSVRNWKPLRTCCFACWYVHKLSPLGAYYFVLCNFGLLLVRSGYKYKLGTTICSVLLHYSYCQHLRNRFYYFFKSPAQRYERDSIMSVLYFQKSKLGSVFPKKSTCSRPPENRQISHRFQVGVGSYWLDSNVQGYVYSAVASNFKGRLVSIFFQTSSWLFWIASWRPPVIWRFAVLRYF